MRALGAGRGFVLSKTGGDVAEAVDAADLKSAGLRAVRVRVPPSLPRCRARRPGKMGESVAVETVAEAYLALLKARGIDWLFANAGTDFAPIIEAFCARRRRRARAARAARGAARDRRGRHGARLLPRDRAAAGGHGARQRRHGERADGPAQRRARQRADPVHLRAHADHRGGAHRRARPADPLGPGDARPGRHAARVRQVGL